MYPGATNPESFSTPKPETGPCPTSPPKVLDLGRMPYAAAYAVQNDYVEEVLAAREAGLEDPGRILLVEHDPPVVTVSRRPGAAGHLVASPALLVKHGVEVASTDRGGDITYHGPGQLVVYPILDLNVYHLRLHDYMRLLEEVTLRVCLGFGVEAMRDPGATGVWTVMRPEARGHRPQSEPGSVPGGLAGGVPDAKICALGVRVRRWVSMHGLALNVTTNLEHFGLIVPCGLAGRGVTSLERELGAGCPTMDGVKRKVAVELSAALAVLRLPREAPK